MIDIATHYSRSDRALADSLASELRTKPLCDVYDHTLRIPHQHHRGDSQFSSGIGSMHMSLGPHRPTPKHHFRPATITSATPTSFTLVVNVERPLVCDHLP
ncbi:BZ3500_MvSof-1268-A1-R1_Chr6-3g09034 [Microbotryum saponariae]|uniref:BZ3500_MvSof-1268-A1-R1_Chr6-3g09034 protein n=1 Tax=Microbotryum saponariae TaxID=289078 RepID=A0A2X0KM88_9BASI|nr:BZ3500_MvSof-1268-A1-R1_Chr6-3g09034 [Microbotryum saponariae]SDA07636.1 BZ3501_MvSof-1269-A2-R1_Chr6-2g08738 [Microbotryum saponariae]